jgi:lipopolysaccharide transport system permease protein
MPPINIWFLPILVVLVFGASLGIGLWLAALTVEYRDFRYIVPFMVQLGLYISPVGFQSGIVPAPYQALYSLNPMVGIIDGFRWSVLGTHSSTLWSAMTIAVIEVILLVASGIWYFRKTERTFADVI